MCFFYSIDRKAKELANRFNAKFKDSDKFAPTKKNNGFSFPVCPVISNHDKTSIQLYQWGLIPSQTQNLEHAFEVRKNTLNSRSETIFEKPLFKQIIKNQRCIVICTGFYEWHHAGKTKTPYLISITDNEIFSLAGIFEIWNNPITNELHHSFSILTTQANSVMAEIHNTKQRMPLILSPNDEMRWLENKTQSELLEIMQPYPSDKMLITKLIDNEPKTLFDFV